MTPRRHGITAPLDGPLRLVVEFRFPMPKAARNVSATPVSMWKSTQPDSDKL